MANPAPCTLGEYGAPLPQTVAVHIRSSFIRFTNSAPLKSGHRSLTTCLIIAACPATEGDAIDVPLFAPYADVEPAIADFTDEPREAISGFSISSLLGPHEVLDEFFLSAEKFATAIISSALAGEPTVAVSGKSDMPIFDEYQFFDALPLFPAAAITLTPAAVAAAMVLSKMDDFAKPCELEAILKLITSAPNFTASSIALLYMLTVVYSLLSSNILNIISCADGATPTNFELPILLLFPAAMPATCNP